MTFNTAEGPRPAHLLLYLDRPIKIGNEPVSMPEEVLGLQDFLDAALAPQSGGVDILEIEQVGNYAIKPVFSDDHASGIYSWDLLYALATARHDEQG